MAKGKRTNVGQVKGPQTEAKMAVVEDQETEINTKEESESEDDGDSSDSSVYSDLEGETFF